MLSQISGQEYPIVYASRTAERCYSQSEKEGLAIAFGEKKFHLWVPSIHVHADVVNEIALCRSIG